MHQSIPSRRIAAVAGLIAGLVAGIVFHALLPDSSHLVINLIGGGGFGLLFGLLFRQSACTAGASLVWGSAYGVLAWLVGPLTLLPLLSGQDLQWTLAAVTAVFPLLLGYVIVYGAFLGSAYCFIAWGLNRVVPPSSVIPAPAATPGHPTGQLIILPLTQALLMGGLGGLVGSLVFGYWLASVNSFSLIAGLVGTDSAMAGQALHYLIGIAIGISFGLLFFRDVQGVGSGLAWGMTYGLLWWMIGPLTVMPWLLGQAPRWSIAAARAAFPSLVGHLLYGALLGLIYALMNKLWQVLFIDSDPLNRPAEGAGTRGLRGLLMGEAGGIIGGLLFTFVMAGVGALPRVASLIGAESVFTGFLVHLVISVIIGSSYGLLFRNEAYTYGSALGWGLVYGFLWWLVGAMTLFAVLLRQPLDWSLAMAVAIYPSLVGHLLYGAGLGLFFHFLARRYDTEFSGHLQRGRPQPQPRRRVAGTPAPALWAFTLLLGVMLPMILTNL